MIIALAQPKPNVPFSVPELKSSNDTEKYQEAENDVYFKNLYICLRPIDPNTEQSSHVSHQLLLMGLLVLLYPIQFWGVQKT